mmetsp:Transcript_28679/g.78859  ORF Transcript_28679/g.78859 Transcript_28679/m.78859 type:complete len:395 (-) Transcript_28679:173-1357(-)
MVLRLVDNRPRSPCLMAIGLSRSHLHRPSPSRNHVQPTIPRNRSTTSLGGSRSSLRPSAHESAALPALRGLEERLARFESLTTELAASAQSLAGDVRDCRQAHQLQLGRVARSLEDQQRQLHRVGTLLQVRRSSVLAEQVGDDRLCRFCFTAGGGPLLAPCRCTGSQRWVHATCLLKWRGSSQRRVGSRHSCEVCLAKYRLSGPSAAVGQLLVPAPCHGPEAPLQAPALLVDLGESAELVELGCSLASDAIGRPSLRQTTRLLGGPCGEDWALADLQKLPLCELPSSVQVNGAILQALRAVEPGSRPPTPCLLTGPVAAVLHVCEAADDCDCARVLHFVGRQRWPKKRLQKLLDHGVLGVASASLEELLTGREQLLETLQGRASFAAAWAGGGC